MGMLWFAGWWLVLALWLVVKVYCWVHPPSEWEYTMGGDL